MKSNRIAPSSVSVPIRSSRVCREAFPDFERKTAHLETHPLVVAVEFEEGHPLVAGLGRRVRPGRRRLACVRDPGAGLVPGWISRWLDADRARGAQESPDPNHLRQVGVGDVAAAGVASRAGLPRSGQLQLARAAWGLIGPVQQQHCANTSAAQRRA